MQGVVDGNHQIFNGYTPKCPNCGTKTVRTFDYDIDDTKKDYRYECPNCGHWEWA
jgi:predicted RNA-binding Zn-ribbon protein involved in translation (DUF1610 family)